MPHVVYGILVIDASHAKKSGWQWFGLFRSILQAKDWLWYDDKVAMYYSQMVLLITDKNYNIDLSVVQWFNLRWSIRSKACIKGIFCYEDIGIPIIL